MMQPSWEQMFQKSEALVGQDNLDQGGSRKAAWNKFCHLGWPGRREEAWRYFPLKKLSEKSLSVPDMSYNVPMPDVLTLDDLMIRPTLYQTQGVWQLPDDMLHVDKLQSVALEPLSLDTFENDAMMALHRALMLDGFIIDVPKHMAHDPIYLVSTQTLAGLAQHSKQVIRLREGASLVLWEYIQGDDLDYFNHTVTECYLGPGSRLKHIKVVSEGAKSAHVSRTVVMQDRDSHYEQASYLWGSTLMRHELAVHMRGQGAECQLKGMMAAGENSQAGQVTRVYHHAPHCTSSQLYKGLAWANGASIFDGTIHVDHGAHQTQGSQMNHNLLLSDESTAKSKPQLVIDHDDVMCRHGATSGSLDRDALFYLQSRGFSDCDARRLLIKAFVTSLWDDVTDDAWSKHLSCLLDERVQI